MPRVYISLRNIITHTHTILYTRIRRTFSASVFVVVHCFFPLLPSREPRDRSSSVVDWRRFSRSLTAIKNTRTEFFFKRNLSSNARYEIRLLGGAARSTRCSPVLSKKVSRGATDGLSKWKRRRRESHRLLRRRAAVLGERRVRPARGILFARVVVGAGVRIQAKKNRCVVCMCACKAHTHTRARARVRARVRERRKAWVWSLVCMCIVPRR